MSSLADVEPDRVDARDAPAGASSPIVYWAGLAGLMSAFSIGWIRLEAWSGGLVVGAPLNAFALTCFLLSRTRRWPGILLLFFLGCVAVTMPHGKTLPVAASIAFVNGLQVLGCAAVLRRILGRRIELGRYRDLAVFSLAAGICMPLLSVCLVSLAQPQHHSLAERLPTLLHWAIGAGLSYLLVTPTAIAWSPGQVRALARHLGAKRVLLTLLAYGAVVLLIALQRSSEVRLLLIPALLWLTFQLGSAGATLGLTLQAIVITACVVWRVGPGSTGGGLADMLAQLQIALALNSVCAYPVAAALSQRWRLGRSLEESHASLRASEARYRLLTETSDDLIIMTDHDGRMLYASPAALKLTGYRPEDLSHGLLHPDDAPRADEMGRALHRDPDNQGHGDFTYRMRHRDGRWIWLEMRSAPLRDPDSGEFTGLMHVARDVTERKAMEEELARKAAEAEAASRAKSEFLANMSHEIRTPLNGVMGVAGALARTELAPAQMEMVSLIETSAQTLETLLSDILDLARIEAGKMELRPEPFDLATSVNACAALFDAAAQAKGLDLTVAVAQDALGAYVGDAPRIRQVLSNLLGNAVKFTKAGGIELTVAAHRGEICSELVFAVRDTGIGFDAETKARLFSRFEQADGSITRRFGGTGLGLSISRCLAEAMGGTLEADATLGEGAVFTLTVELPRCEGALDLWGDDAESEPAPDPLIGMRVLLAEDHPTNRRVVELILGSAGVDVICVENGADAIEAYRSRSFDLILMDMQMPVMDGLTAVRDIRSIEAASGAPRIPIHVLTGNAMPEHVKASMAAGADGHLSKPILAEALLARVAEARLGAHAQSADIRTRQARAI